MVHGLPRLLGCGGIILALTLTCAHAPLRAETLATASGRQGQCSCRRPWDAPGQPPAHPLPYRHAQGGQVSGFLLTDPNRLVIDVEETKLRLPPQPTGAPVGLVKSFRAGEASADRSRVVIEVTEPVIVSSSRIEKTADGKSQQLVVEIMPFGPAHHGKHRRERACGLDRPLIRHRSRWARRGCSRRCRAQRCRRPCWPRRSFKPIIVIDPGHGGHDSGAEKNGAVEKDIVLAFGKILANKLKATGRFKVLMTRDTDVFIPLGDRVSFAEHNKANLFIAIHCDYADTGSVANGATIYSLRELLADGLRRSTKGEISGNLLSQAEAAIVKEASGDVEAVKGILSDLAGREVDVTHDRTSVFARSVIEGMGASTALRNEPDQTAGFRVLKTAQFPSVLIELAYVTNKQDAENLQSDAWRDKVSDSIMSAIDKYFSSQMAQLPM